MAAKHTPGPWTWEGNTLRPVDNDPTTSAVHSILDAEGGYGYMSSKPSDTVAELEACRRLIAAAPDLLEALRAAYSDIQRLPGHTIDMLGRIEAAITLATEVPA